MKEKELKEKKDNIKKNLDNIFKKKDNFFILGILLLGFIVRFYFLITVKDQAHWWDTLAYGSLAKEMIFHYWSDNAFLIHESIIRPPLLPLFWAFLLKLGISDFLTIVFLEIVPSVASVWLIFLTVRDLYDKNVALISAFISSIAWIHLFYSVRIMTDVPSLFLALVSIYFFVKSYEKLNLKPFALSIFFLSLAALMRFQSGLLGFAYLAFLLIIHRHRVLTRKSFWIGGIIGSIPMAIFFLINLLGDGSIFPAASIYSQSAVEKSGFAYYVFGFTPHIMGTLFTSLFVLGLVIVLFNLALGFDSLLKVRRLRSNLLVSLILLVYIVFFVFILRAAEDRYLMIIFVPLFALSSLAILFVYDYLKKYFKIVSIITVIAILLGGGYYQLTFAKEMIEGRKESFKPMKEAFLWINENTPEDSVIIGDWADPYAIYYSERKLGKWPGGVGTDPEALENFSLEGVDYLTLTTVHQPTQNVVEFANRKAEEGRISPVQIFFFDETRTRPAVVIYQVNKNS